MSEEHWSSPNGCHPDCPACAEEAEVDELENEIIRLNQLNRELLAALDDITDLPADDNGSRIIPAGYLDAARAAIQKARGQ